MNINSRNIFSLISIQTKAWLIMCVLFILCLVLNMTILHKTLLSKFIDLEEFQVKQNIERVYKALNGKLKHLNSTNNDWASWDDSYDYIKTNHPEFVENNLIESTLPSLNLNFLYFIDKQGSVAWRRSIDLKTGNDIDIPELPADRLPKNHPLLGNSISPTGKTGIFHTGSGPALVSAAPILDSYGNGPMQGWIIMGRLLNNDVMKSLSELTQLTLSIPPETPFKESEDKRKKLKQLDSHTTYKIIGPNSIHGYTFIEGIAGTEGLAIQIAMSRDIYQKGISTIQFMTFLITVTMLLIFLLLSTLLKGFIISPITRLTNHILDLEKTKNIKLRVPQKEINCRDEACILAIQVNKLLATIEEVHEKLKEDARIDPLTMLANRRCYNEHLANKWQHLMRSQGHISIIMCDIDHFKLYNDHYGHQKGDDCLKKVAGLIKSIPQRPYDMVARYGGEEFVIVLPNANKSDAALLAEKIRKKILDCKIPHEKSPTDQWVTLSLGAASAVVFMNSKPDDLVKQADQALYKAKELGRNQVVVI